MTHWTSFFKPTLFFTKRDRSLALVIEGSRISSFGAQHLSMPDFAQFSEHSGKMWNISKMGAEQRRNKKYWRWKDDAPEAGPFATPVPSHPCTQPPPPPPPSQCTRAITSSPWKRYYLALAPLVESWGRHVLIRLLHSLLCAVLLLLLENGLEATWRPP